MSWNHKEMVLTKKLTQFVGLLPWMHQRMTFWVLKLRLLIRIGQWFLTMVISLFLRSSIDIATSEFQVVRILLIGLAAKHKIGIKVLWSPSEGELNREQKGTSKVGILCYKEIIYFAKHTRIRLFVDIIYIYWLRRI